MLSGVIIIVRAISTQMGFPRALVSCADVRPMTNPFESLYLSIYRELPQKWDPQIFC